MRQQGAWMKWEQAMERRVTWKDIWQWNPQRIKFLIQGVYDVLPSPSNLCIWGKTETPTCPLCSKIGTLEHILSSCSKALGEGRYRWRHDQVLKSIAEAISKGINGSRYTQAPAKAIHFVKEGQRPERTSNNCSAGLLSTARDWVMTVDLERQLKIPSHITQTRLRPDIILVSEATKQLLLLELTVPWEERMEEAQERKREKYQELVEDCRRNGWRTRCMPVEVGSRGFASHSLSKAYGALGIKGANRSRAINNNAEAAEKASRWLWLKRGEQWAQ